MKCLFQIVTRADGRRCPPGVFERSQFASVLRKMLDEFPDIVTPEDYVLVLVEHVDSDQGNYSTAPMMTIDYFLESFSAEVSENA